jgi:aspartate aminotransferase-like enzyme
MNSTINLTTGPVQIAKKVMAAFSETPISHRSDEFINLYKSTSELLCLKFYVQHTYILSGSGTLANEIMLQEISQIRGKGLILSNGEFGNRLINQATRIGLHFSEYVIEWGKEFEMTYLEKFFTEHAPQWILFCHCETSTGVINDIKRIASVCKMKGCMCFVDCMSTVGTTSLNLSDISMATASSGKGFAAIPGLAIILSNIETSVKTDIPMYLDLGYYKLKDGIPFTISSNLLKALHVSITMKLDSVQYESTHAFGVSVYNALQSRSLVPYSNTYSKVFTLVAGNNMNVIENMKTNGLILSNESEYLKSRNWYQLAIFGSYTQTEINTVLSVLQ